MKVDQWEFDVDLPPTPPSKGRVHIMVGEDFRHDTHVYASDGTDLANRCFDMRFEYEPRNAPRAWLALWMPKVDVIANADVREVCPHCGHMEEKE